MTAAFVRLELVTKILKLEKVASGTNSHFPKAATSRTLWLSETRLGESVIKISSGSGAKKLMISFLRPRATFKTVLQPENSEIQSFSSGSTTKI